MIDVGVLNVRGLNRQDPQVAVGDLISENKLHYLGILETCVSFMKDALIDLADNIMDIPWLVLGDFNTVVDISEVASPGPIGELYANAFIPDRSISDNILLAQELFSRYNQQRLPQRCAMKVDLRKAYDTMEWDFLLATLHLFGFPRQFILWIQEYVITCSFSVNLNDNIHGFFQGSHGLRQGDPVSLTCVFLSWRSFSLLYNN
ncbi:UNVERIFIED_CONTAM: hypothetical protein Sradi_6649200 [Sesamum radiatum]|uniref:Reverse transcriptase domain-containing protein n=1 Tax=Sesamum radiatum TaxID=300843 RepID=A0AAW2JP16_SESRA